MDLQKRLAFSKIIFEDFVIPDLVENILEEYDKRNKAVLYIQKQYIKFRDNSFEKEMIEKGYFKLLCGNWSSGGQCMCDICYDIL